MEFFSRIIISGMIREIYVLKKKFGGGSQRCQEQVKFLGVVKKGSSTPAKPLNSSAHWPPQRYKPTLKSFLWGFMALGRFQKSKRGWELNGVVHEMFLNNHLQDSEYKQKFSSSNVEKGGVELPGRKENFEGCTKNGVVHKQNRGKLGRVYPGNVKNQHWGRLLGALGHWASSKKQKGDNFLMGQYTKNFQCIVLWMINTPKSSNGTTSNWGAWGYHEEKKIFGAIGKRVKYIRPTNENRGAITPRSTKTNTEAVCWGLLGPERVPKSEKGMILKRGSTWIFSVALCSGW